MTRPVLTVPCSRHFAIPWLVMLLLSGLAGGLPRFDASAQAEQLSFDLELVADGLERPVQVIDPGGVDDALLVVEQPGAIRLVRDGRVMPEPFLDIAELVRCCGERGLLGMALHPDFAENGQFFVNYTDVDGDTVIARYDVSPPDAATADAGSAEIVLTVAQPAANHNGGQIHFGPNDGYLYIGLGDGGGGNGQNSQDLGILLGKMLRIDVDRGDERRPYAVPADNPFVGQPGARDEIWALGLRNPWRFSFDRATGDLWIGDVGAGAYEEINFQPAASSGGENYGWPRMEGRSCRVEEGCDDLAAPISGFGREFGCVVIGGYVYRGIAAPELEGIMLFADYCSGRVWGLRPGGATGWTILDPVATGLRVSAFGEDHAGELYLVDLDGAVYRIVS